MAPAARLSLPYKKLPSISIAPARFRVQGWDPLLIIAQARSSKPHLLTHSCRLILVVLFQIVALQTLHYLTLAVLLPPLLRTFASPSLLAYEGGPTSVSLIMHWREFTGKATESLRAARRSEAMEGLVSLAVAKAGLGAGRVQVGGEMDPSEMMDGLVRVVGDDPMRGWAVALAWMTASMIE